MHRPILRTLGAVRSLDRRRVLLPMVLDDDLGPSHGLMPYRVGQMVSWSLSR